MRLHRLVELGVTVVEVMPVAEFTGAFGWGYDGVDLFAPYHVYGKPDDMRRFVNQAHKLGLGVILDVVYNHFGPEGCYHHAFSSHYIHKERRGNDWGDALNFDGPDSGPVREYFIANAGYWISEYHLDGLRLDATHAIHDSSTEHILARSVAMPAPWVESEESCSSPSTRRRTCGCLDPWTKGVTDSMVSGTMIFTTVPAWP